MAKGSDIASSGTTDIGAATGNYVQITGTTTITSLGTAAQGVWRNATFTGVLTLTYNVTSLILPTSANITTAAGDTALFVSEGGGNWRCLFYSRRSGAALVGGAGGDASTNTASSVVDEVALFADTSGKLLKRSTGTGLLNLTSGVASTLAMGAGVATFLTTPSSANLISALTDETGTGACVFANTPTLVSPILGTPTSGTLTSCTGYTVANLSGAAAGVLTFLATPTSANLISAVTDETGTGSLVFANTPTLVSPILGTPTSGTLTSCTGYTVANLAGAGANVLTFLATPSSANLLAAITDETGTGSVVFANTPTLVTPVLGAATATSIGLAQALHGSATLTTAATTADQVLLSVSATTYRALIVEISILSSTSYHVLNVMIIHDGTSASHTQYGDIFTGASLTTINSDINTGNMRLLVTPTNAVTVYRITYRAIAA
jgi:hypothetical protein